VRPGATTTSASPTASAPASGGTPVTPSTPRPSDLGGTAAGGSGTDHLSERARTDAEQAAAHARSAADEAVAGVRGKAAEMRQQAEGMVEDARRQAQELAGEQKNLAAERVNGFASALRHASSDLDEQGQSMVSGFVRQAADGLESFSGAMQRNDVDDLVGSIEDFARRQPAVFIGSAVLAGFGIARFMKSSSERRRGRGFEQQRSGFQTRPGYGAAPGTTYEGGV
jgi:F0F1-type ATP synthase membrane subunit b/b'